MASQNDVFISYATDTKPLAEELTHALQREGISTWAAFKDLQPGQLWRDELEQALERAQSFVILVSPQSQATRWSEAEWQAVLTKAWADSEKRLIPVVVGGNEPPPFLREWVTLRIDPAAKSTQWTADVLRVLRSAPSRTAHGLAKAERQDRQQRLDEMARATEKLRQREMGQDQPH